ncbi:unknown [Ruminococcus sp. CAG:90]|nr:unknown [Ruminococcus sp. CAG:90]
MVIVKSYFYIVKNRHILEKTDILEGSGDSGFVDLDGAFSGDVLAVQSNDSFCWFVYTCEKVEYRCLTGTVGSDQSIELSFFNGHVKAVNSTKTAELDRQVIYFQHCHDQATSFFAFLPLNFSTMRALQSLAAGAQLKSIMMISTIA